MPSGKRARQQRQEAAATAVKAPPPVRSKGAGGVRPARQASPRALAIGGGIIAVIVIAIVLAVVLGRSGGGSTNSGSGNIADYPPTGNATGATALPNAPAANALFAGIPQNGLFLGKSGAPVTMEMFIDVQCPICQNYEVNYLPAIVQNYVRSGKVQIHLQPWAFIGPQSHTGRLGLIAAAAQNKGFQYAKVLYDNQGQENSGWLTDGMMMQIASSVNGLKMREWNAARLNPDATQIASEVDQHAQKLGVAGTPTILIGRTGGKLHDIMPAGYSPDLQRTEQVLNQALAQT